MPPADAAPTAPPVPTGRRPAAEDTLDLPLPTGHSSTLRRRPRHCAAPTAPSRRPPGPGGGRRTATCSTGVAPAGAAADTPAGASSLVPVRLERDLAARQPLDERPGGRGLLGAGRARTATTAAHLRAQLDGDGRSVPCLGVLDGTPMSYWEIYRADLDPLARHYPARPHDTGIHLLIGGVADRGRGLGSTLLRAVADLVLDHRPALRAASSPNPTCATPPPSPPSSAPASGSPPRSTSPASAPP